MGRDEQLIELARRLLAAAGRTRSAVGPALAELGLTETGAALIWRLGVACRPATMRELAADLACDPSNVTLLADRLERAGLVARQPHPTDARARTLALTEKGRGVHHRLLGGVDEHSPLAVLDGAERQELTRLLAKVLDG